MPAVVLGVKLPKNRDASGTLTVETGGKRIKSYEALGRGSRGKGDTQLMGQGNTPTGTYGVPRLVDTSSWPRSSYGPNGALRLEPFSGNALKARDEGDRSGLLVHGGDLGGPKYWRGEAELRATHGCLRLSNDDMEDLVRTLQALSLNAATKTCDVNSITVVVEDADGLPDGQYATPIPRP